jgi:hypothetical protein
MEGLAYKGFQVAAKAIKARFASRWSCSGRHGFSNIEPLPGVDTHPDSAQTLMLT